MRKNGGGSNRTKATSVFSDSFEVRLDWKLLTLEELQGIERDRGVPSTPRALTARQHGKGSRHPCNFMHMQVSKRMYACIMQHARISSAQYPMELLAASSGIIIALMGKLDFVTKKEKVNFWLRLYPWLCERLANLYCCPR